MGTRLASGVEAHDFQQASKLFSPSLTRRFGCSTQNSHHNSTSSNLPLAHSPTARNILDVDGEVLEDESRKESVADES